MADVSLAPQLVPSHPVELAAAEVLPDSAVPEARVLEPATIVEERRRLPRLLGWVWRVAVRVWGALSLIIGLAILATLPGMNLLSLGYLLEASGRIARTRRFAAGFIGLRTAAVIGAVVFAGWLARWPIVAVADFWYASHLIDPASRPTKIAATLWFLLVLALVMAVAGCAWIAARIWPDLYATGRDRLWELVTQRLPYYFWLGLRGFVGAMLWLIVPVSIMASAAKLPPGPGALVSVLGGVLLVPVLIYLPFLQTHFAAEGRFGAMFDVGAVRQLFRRAPIAFWLALFTMLLFALPLYLLMIEAVPEEVAWLPSIVFVVFLFPARLLAGWAYARGAKRETPRLWLFRWLSRLGMLPPAITYAFFVWLSQYLLWYGVFSLYHQHAFLLPAPFVGM
jgi:hypothetical protein